MFAMQRWNHLLGICLVGAIATSCTLVNPFNSRSQSTLNNAGLSLQVQPEDKPGEFTISGTAALPTGTKLTVIAVRQLRLQNSTLIALEPKPTYSILTYDTVTVAGDRWQTTLSLWQVASNGEYKEAWQLQVPELKLAVEPEDEVLFLVTLAPFDDLEAIEQQLAQNNQRLARQFIQTTSEGDRYLQTGQLLAVALPSGTTNPIGIREEDINGGWGNRFLDLPDLPNERQLDFPEQRQTNAPVTQEEFLY